MSAVARRQDPSPNAGSRPSLFVLTTCRFCDQGVTEVRSTDDRPVPLDGRDPDGEWLAVRVDGQWRVTKLQPGAPAPAGGVRYAEHRCCDVVVFLTGMGAEEIPAAPGRCVTGCGTPVLRYGRDVSDMCRDCQQVFAEWQQLPDDERGAPAYGLLVDGVYVRPGAGHGSV